MKLCKFYHKGAAGFGLQEGDSILDLRGAGFANLAEIFEQPNPAEAVRAAASRTLPKLPASELQLLPPVDAQEVWAAGVTYLRSKKARMEESEMSASAYDRVYDAERPEIFFKALPEKVVGPGGTVGIRRDARWNVPEPELALVLSSKGSVVGFTIGNDMSSRDIEGENVLYLPQAKIYRSSCALGPCVRLADETEARSWKITLEIKRGGGVVFAGETSVSQIKRSFTELAGFLFRSQEFGRGAILLTGTGIVPPDQFTLQEGDQVAIGISGIGTLSNRVVVV